MMTCWSIEVSQPRETKGKKKVIRAPVSPDKYGFDTLLRSHSQPEERVTEPLQNPDLGNKYPKA